MVPINGFFEYGIAALLGAAVMIVLGILALVGEANCEADESSVGADRGTVVPDYPFYKKAA